MQSGTRETVLVVQQENGQSISPCGCRRASVFGSWMDIPGEGEDLVDHLKGKDLKACRLIVRKSMTYSRHILASGRKARHLGTLPPLSDMFW